MWAFKHNTNGNVIAAAGVDLRFVAERIIMPWLLICGNSKSRVDRSDIGAIEKWLGEDALGIKAIRTAMGEVGQVFNVWERT